MTTLKVNINKIKRNIKRLKEKLKEKDLEMILVTKVLNGNKKILSEFIKKEKIGDSRLETIKWIKKNHVRSKTVLIKPPSLSEIEDVIKWCDFSHASNMEMIKLVDECARHYQKKHKIYVMVEMGDCREGFYRKDLYKMIEDIRKLKNIKIVGLGANFGCISGKVPNSNSIKKLVFIKEKCEKIVKRKLLLASSSTSSLHLLEENKLAGANEIRIGTAAFLGTRGTDKPIKWLEQDIWNLEIEILQKRGKEYLLNIGEIDISFKDWNIPYHWLGSSSEMSVIKTKEKLGQTVTFEINDYKRLRSLMLSPTIKRVCVND